MGTGSEQKITITSSTNLSDEDIDKAVKEAEKFAEEDKKKKEEVDVRNNADSLVYQTEKTLGELGDKISADEKSSVQSEVDKLKELLKASPLDTEAVKAQTDSVQKSFYAISEKLYAQAQQAQQAQQGAAQGQQTDGAAQNPGGDNVVDAEYTEVHDDKK